MLPEAFYHALENYVPTSIQSRSDVEAATAAGKIIWVPGRPLVPGEARAMTNSLRILKKLIFVGMVIVTIFSILSLAQEQAIQIYGPLAPIGGIIIAVVGDVVLLIIYTFLRRQMVPERGATSFTVENGVQVPRKGQGLLIGPTGFALLGPKGRKLVWFYWPWANVTEVAESISDSHYPYVARAHEFKITDRWAQEELIRQELRSNWHIAFHTTSETWGEILLDFDFDYGEFQYKPPEMLVSHCFGRYWDLARSK